MVLEIDKYGTKQWFKDGKRHRLNGPAVEFISGFKCWYINGREYTQKEFRKIVDSVSDNKYKDFKLC